LTVANRLVPRLGGSAKRLTATLPSGPSPQLVSFADGDEEVRAIVERCRALNAEGVPWEEMAILTRINGRSEDFEEAFAAAKIPYQVRDGAFLARPAARAMVVRANRAARAAEPVKAEPAAELALAREAVVRIAADLGYDPNGSYESGEEATRQADLHRLVQLAEAFDGDLESFLADLKARFAREEEGRGAQLMTYHRAKGLEFEAVFLPRIEEKELPFAMATADEDVAEERRLLYVGITRAKRHLFLSHADLRPGERRTKPKPSRFLRELTTMPQAPARAAGRRPPARAAEPAAPAVPADDPRFGRLRAWRRQMAAEKGVPPYVIFHDSTLAEIAVTRPASPAALRMIAGVGPTRVQRYGEQLLSIVATESQPEETVTASG
jgi:DNA helicase-2/ATP-dependent DNA helicase PcrA